MKYDINSINKRKKASKTFKRVIDIILIILIYNIILVMVSCMNKIDEINLFGCKAYIITTDSMYPSIKKGDVIITKKANEEELQINDVITFERNNEIITHRITKIEEENSKKVYTTKGDNNNVEDYRKVEYNDIKGKNIITIPYLGNIIRLLENKIVFLIIVLVLLILYFYRIQILEKKENRREKKRIEKEGKNQVLK